MTELDRKRISYLRLVLVLALVFLHYGGVYGSDISPYIGYTGQDLPVASIMISFILYIGFTAVPAMSAISGYLFFQGATRDKPPQFARKLRRRATSLALPFLLWSSFFAVVGYLVHIYVVPGLFGDEFSTTYRSHLHVIADVILGYSRTPLAFQLWFVHDLILTVIFSPLIWILIGRLPWITIAILVPLWILDFHFWIFHRLDVVVFFCFGAACAMHGLKPDLPKPAIVPVFVLFLAVAMARTVAPYYLGHSTGIDLDIATAAMRVLGALAVWNASSLVLNGAFAEWVERNSYMAFFIHCAHYPPILFLKIALATLVATDTETGQIILYFVTVFLTIGLLVALGNALQRRTPEFFRIISGGRVRPGHKTEASGFLPTRG
ncbi:acyltransferase family protein [Amaricoccus solimangrovi]|uniref:Acyltransferase n=1 Tax=Amaricoccus solimangrovi TaxID=2589815 RepID=A0A501WRW1_9RHOB|nr:acyltransferase [Amaricoccus solimangrovi]TPE50814.1 acyltransferase [Amaricoccus solimangrovi]